MNLIQQSPLYQPLKVGLKPHAMVSPTDLEKLENFLFDANMKADFAR